jgi:hypothetical protein
MPVRTFHHRLGASALLLLGVALSGCGSVGDAVSPAFVDPARYELWDCKQLEGERKALAKRLEELQQSMAKAETGTAGPVVAEMVYRNDYISTRGQQKLAEEAWRRNRCQESPPTAAAPPGSHPAATGPKSRAAPASKSGGAVY